MPKRGKSEHKGKLIVIEGTDGSGKATQSKLLVEKLEKEGFKVKTIDFPQYGRPCAKKVEDYLAGKFGKVEDVSPYDAARFYAEDRVDAAPMMKRWLEEGDIIIANRYQQSNKGHQASKIKDPGERKRFMEWIDDLEYSQNMIPRPDAVIFLHVPAEIAQTLITKRGNRKDIHEADTSHLKDTEQAYMEIAKKERWIMIECVKEGRIMQIGDIQRIVWEKSKDIFR
ncbi:thymidylate kinase [Candidatus Woesearchaeota archaeon CG10_big_fil_rev_8_21_14_0_10_44_13]|nr:MAG: thymidylate kinase [Candidatus Woesearchaeota archaeon CG10_big_fil_rev_8_21_14_0_10_44_13]